MKIRPRMTAPSFGAPKVSNRPHRVSTFRTLPKRSRRGEVVVAGPGRTNDKGDVRALTVAAGDQILFSKYSGTEIKLDGEELIILREDDIRSGRCAKH